MGLSHNSGNSPGDHLVELELELEELEELADLVDSKMLIIIVSNS